MKYHHRLVIAAGLLVLFSSSANAQTPVSAPSVPEWLTNAVLLGVTILWVLALVIIIKSLRKQNWNLGEALSEEATLPPGTPTPAAGQEPPTLPSSSRLIALIGTVLNGSFFIGIGYYVLWQLFNGQPVTAATNAWQFFLAGSTLFLPYGVNKVTSILK